MLPNKMAVTKISERILLKEARTTIMLEPNRVMCIRSLSKYSVMYLAEGGYRVSLLPMKYYSELLHLKGFYRVDHGYIVNLTQIAQIDRGKTCVVTLNNGRKVYVSHRKKKDFLAYIHAHASTMFSGIAL